MYAPFVNQSVIIIIKHLDSRSLFIITRNFSIAFINKRKETLVVFLKSNFNCFKFLNCYNYVFLFFYHLFVETKFLVDNDRQNFNDIII